MASAARPWPNRLHNKQQAINMTRTPLKTCSRAAATVRARVSHPAPLESLLTLAPTHEGAG